MPQKDFGRSIGRGGSGGGAAKRAVAKIKAKGAVVQGKAIVRSANSRVGKMQRDLMQEARNTTRRAATARKHPSGYLIDPRDGTVLDKNLKVVKRASGINRAKARVNMVKNSPAARDLKKVKSKITKKRGK